MKYHINYKHWEPRECNAKPPRPCPLKEADGSPRQHFETEEKAWKHLGRIKPPAEEVKHRKPRKTKKDRELSQGALIVLKLQELREHLDLLDSIPEDEQTREDYERIDEILRERDVWEEKFLTLEPSSEAPVYDDSLEMEHTPYVVPDPYHITGVSNSLFPYQQCDTTKKMVKELQEISKEWITRLSNNEILAVARYNRASDDYAKMVEGQMEPDNAYLNDLYSAINKAPKLRQPMKVYSGISSHRSQAIHRQGQNGRIDMMRVQSFTANPAIINSFMNPESHFDPDKNTLVAVETHITRGAFLNAFNIHSQEMEVLVPPNYYAVSSIREKVDYKWQSGSGKTADYVYEIEPLRIT